MFVYLSLTGMRVELPTAVGIAQTDEASEQVDFVDAGGRVVARFRRQDLALRTMQDLGEMAESAGDGHPAVKG